MDALLERIAIAQTDHRELERLISDYLPFIKKTIAQTGDLGLEYDDRLSLAMLSFVNCVRQYDAEKGNFTTFAAVCIRHRLIDESRKQTRYAAKVVPLFPSDTDQPTETAIDRASLTVYRQEQEQQSLAAEIDNLSGHLEKYGIAFRDLPRICPKQEQSRKQCLALGQFVAANAEMRDSLFRHRRLAQSELAQKFGLSEKTVEKHRKYIVTVVILLTGDYPLIRAFLPQY